MSNSMYQICCKCLNIVVPAVTLTFDGGARRLHWCAKHKKDADQYRDQSDQIREDVEPRSIAHNANARTGVYLGELRDV